MSPSGSSARCKVREVHPEVCFWALNHRDAVGYSKKVKEGIEKRKRILQGVEVKAQKIFDDARCKFNKSCVRDDDIFDALVAAVTAHQGWQCELKVLPETNPSQNDENGLPMEMVFWQPPPPNPG